MQQLRKRKKKKKRDRKVDIKEHSKSHEEYKRWCAGTALTNMQSIEDRDHERETRPFPSFDATRIASEAR